MNICLVGKNPYVKFIRSFLSDDCIVNEMNSDNISSIPSIVRTAVYMNKWDIVIACVDSDDFSNERYNLKSIEYLIGHPFNTITIAYDSTYLDSIIQKENLKDYVINNIDEVKQHVTLYKLIENINKQYIKWII